MNALRTALAALAALLLAAGCEPRPAPPEEPTSDPVVDPDDPVAETPVPIRVPSAAELRLPQRR